MCTRQYYMYWYWHPPQCQLTVNKPWQICRVNCMNLHQHDRKITLWRKCSSIAIGHSFIILTFDIENKQQQVQEGLKLLTWVPSANVKRVFLICNGPKHSNTFPQIYLNHCYAFPLLLKPLSLKKMFVTERQPQLPINWARHWSNLRRSGKNIIIYRDHDNIFLALSFIKICEKVLEKK